MDNKTPDSVPYIVYESERARSERIIKRLIAALIVTIILSFAVIYSIDTGWRSFIEESDIETYEYSQDGTGVNIVGNENGVDTTDGTAR